MKRHLRFLHLEDNPQDAELIGSALGCAGNFEFDRVIAKNKADFETAILQGGFDIIISTSTLSDYCADQALAFVQKASLGVPFILVSESMGEEKAVERLLNGAADYVSKTSLSRLVPAVNRALARSASLAHERQFQEQLRQNEALFRKIMQNIDDLIAVVDLNGRRIFSSPSYEALLAEVDLTAGSDLFEEVHPKDRDHVRRVFNETALTGHGRRAEYRIVLKDGAVRDIEAQGTALRDANGKITHVLVVSRDITARKEAEEKVRDQAAWLDKAQDAICVKDLSQQILYWNKAAERLYGWTAGEAIGRNANELLFRGNQEPALKALREMIRRGEWQGEMYQMDRHGRQLIVESRWTLMRGDQGQPKSILVINTDVTEKRQTEAKFLRNQRMESIGALAGGIAHDLNNALAPILMAADLLGASSFRGEQPQIAGYDERQRAARVRKWSSKSSHSPAE